LVRVARIAVGEERRRIRLTFSGPIAIFPFLVTVGLAATGMLFFHFLMVLGWLRWVEVNNELAEREGFEPSIQALTRIAV
jgi:hypothetical protein